MANISEAMGNLGISISHNQIHQIEKLVVHFLLRRAHPLTFNGMMLGVNPIAFTTSDYNALFDVFNVHIHDIEQTIKTIPSIDRSFNVISDPFNLLSMWLVHLAPIYIKDKTICREFSLNILRYLNYKFFCSVVNNSFKHGTNEGVILATLAALTKKSDIVRYESWKALIDSHCERIIDPHDRFYHTVVEGAPDEAFLKVISETQGMIRTKVVTYAQSYYFAHASGDSISSHSSVGENEEGEKILAQTASVIESATTAIVSEVLNPNSFISDILVDDVAKQFTTISPRMLKMALLRVNETAVLQTSSRKFDYVEKHNGDVLFVGIRALLIEIIRSMVSLCVVKRINMGSKARVYEAMKNVYSSSRNTDPDIITVKKSVAHLVDSFNITTNQASLSALRLSVIYYVLYKTITRLHV